MTSLGCTLPPEPSSVAAARRFVQDTLDAWGLDEAAWTAALLISELATNAVIHGRTPYSVEISRDADTVRVGVLDGSPVAPGLRRYGSDSTTGRGLRLVDSMSSRWGVVPREQGKSVFFEIDAGEAGTALSWDDGSEVDLDALLGKLGGEQDLGTTALAHLPSWRAAA